MDQQEGWPLGLQPLSLRLGLIRNFDFLDSVSFSSASTGSPTSTSLTSSDSASESFGSLSQERNVALGSLMGLGGSSLEAMRRSGRRGRRHVSLTERKGKSRAWFSLCGKPKIESEKGDGSASLGQFLEIERKACDFHGLQRIQSGLCHANGHVLPLIFECIGGQVSR
ncbi:uncharacterized protein LOC110018698 [Phalaenopsis equestris]|uniref:uncharacterized protein LOC110018698 n=1 Tax=Phalaenopsis equestris TaxID=78828 RepID=UPI0009E5E4FA|nr:uncharacterized protein LOC110018698 [Phalaenopsis equestris]XP_020571762.1 uncharacterized protein LOC110018698 [Phalaenopsis equestris]